MKLTDLRLFSSFVLKTGRRYEAAFDTWNPNARKVFIFATQQEGQGDCDEDVDCIGSLVCGVDNCVEYNPMVWGGTSTVFCLHITAFECMKIAHFSARAEGW